MPIEALKDTELLRSFLMRDRVGNAYLLGDLDPAYLPYCEWYGYLDGEELQALALLYKGLSLPAVLTVAPPQDEVCMRALDMLISGIRDSLPDRFWVHAWEQHRPMLEAHYNIEGLQRMIRMGLVREQYRRPETSVPVRRLDHPDTAAIMALYQHYPDNFFEPYQLESGLYYGVNGPDGGLSAIAGIHVFSRTYDIAAIGNLVTHPTHRGRGFATAVTTALLDELFQSVSLVTLNVEEGNVAGIGTFEKFGFTHHHVYYEGRVNGRQTP